MFFTRRALFFGLFDHFGPPYYPKDGFRSFSTPEGPIPGLLNG